VSFLSLRVALTLLGSPSRASQSARIGTEQKKGTYIYIYVYVYIYMYMYVYYTYMYVYYTYIYIQARAQTFWGAGAQTQKKANHCQKKILTELKHKHQYTDDAIHPRPAFPMGSIKQLAYIFFMNKDELLYGHNSTSVLIG